MRYSIKKKSDNTVIATGEPESTVLDFEGNWYFAPDGVAMQYLKVTERTYTCPYKGVCNWIDLVTPEGKVTNFGWVYPNPKPGYEMIKDRVAVYVRDTYVTKAVEEQN